MANEMARRILDAINAHPEAFDMDTWFTSYWDAAVYPGYTPSCGTTLCVAGWAAHLDGWTLIAGGDATKDGTRREIFDVGMRLLDLDQEEAHDLFYASEPRAREILAELAEGA